MRIYHRDGAAREGNEGTTETGAGERTYTTTSAITCTPNTHRRAKVHVILWREQAPLLPLLLPRSCNLQLELKLQVVWGMLQLLLLLLQLHNNNKKNNSRVVNKSQLHTHTHRQRCNCCQSARRILDISLLPALPAPFLAQNNLCCALWKLSPRGGAALCLPLSLPLPRRV